jgi:hypothetical protein
MVDDPQLNDANRKALAELRWQRLVEDAGAIFVGIQHGSKTGQPVILFQAQREKEDASESTIALYSSALNSAEDVRMAVKNYLESKRLVRVVGM